MNTDSTPSLDFRQAVNDFVVKATDTLILKVTFWAREVVQNDDPIGKGAQ